MREPKFRSVVFHVHTVWADVEEECDLARSFRLHGVFRVSAVTSPVEAVSMRRTLPSHTKDFTAALRGHGAKNAAFILPAACQLLPSNIRELPVDCLSDARVKE